MSFETHLAELVRLPPWQVSHDGAEAFSAEAIDPSSARREQVEAQLLARGVALPLVHRVCWERHMHPQEALFLCLSDAHGQPVYGWTVRLDRSRTLPGHSIMRVQRYGATDEIGAACAGLAALRQLCDRHGHVLRLQLEVFSPEEAMREALDAHAPLVGFGRIDRHRNCYRQTIRLRLDADEAALFQRLSRSARRNVRAPQKKGFGQRTIDDPAFAPRMAQLMHETFVRSGGSEQAVDWARLIAFSRDWPALSRIIGCFAPGDDGPSGLMSFAWGCHHGDHVSHTAAASLRIEGSNLALSYATAWDLIVWARNHGARWFDFGGVTAGHLDSADSLGGISDFKRFFSEDLVIVGAEWMYEPVKLKGRIADSISAIAGWVRHRA